MQHPSLTDPRPGTRGGPSGKLSRKSLAVASLVPANVVYWGVQALAWGMHARHSG